MPLKPIEPHFWGNREKMGAVSSWFVLRLFSMQWFLWGGPCLLICCSENIHGGGKMNTP